jgi:CDP-diacylglycerol pyrophosphatase
MTIVFNARWIAVASGLIIALLYLATAQAANPNALWDIVHGKCVPDELQHSNPWPCAKVDLARGVGGGFAILKDLNGATSIC